MLVHASYLELQPMLFGLFAKVTVFNRNAK
jgi:hypothetical protein